MTIDWHNRKLTIKGMTVDMFSMAAEGETANNQSTTKDNQPTTQDNQSVRNDNTAEQKETTANKLAVNKEESEQEEKTEFVRAAETKRISPGRGVWLKINTEYVGEGLFEPFAVRLLALGLVTTAALITCTTHNSDVHTYIPIMNISCKPVTLYKNKRIGECTNDYSEAPHLGYIRPGKLTEAEKAKI